MKLSLLCLAFAAGSSDEDDDYDQYVSVDLPAHYSPIPQLQPELVPFLEELLLRLGRVSENEKGNSRSRIPRSSALPNFLTAEKSADEKRIFPRLLQRRGSDSIY